MALAVGIGDDILCLECDDLKLCGFVCLHDTPLLSDGILCTSSSARTAAASVSYRHALCRLHIRDPDIRLYYTMLSADCLPISCGFQSKIAVAVPLLPRGKKAANSARPFSV